MPKRTNYFLPNKKNITQKLIFFLVGGFIRDRLINIINTEKDWVVINSTFTEMFNLHFKLVGKDFPVFLHPINKEEFALARKEKKIQKGYKGFKCYFSKKIILKHDVYRRDLSMNAITMNFDGKIIDIFTFKNYIKNKVIKHISSAFSEDPLRILRVARFWSKYYKKGFLISGHTYFLIKKLVQTDELNYIANERIVKEINKANKYSNIKPYLFFLYMSQTLKVISKFLYINIKDTLTISNNISFNILQKINNSQFYINKYTNNTIVKQLNIINITDKLNINKHKLILLLDFYKQKLILSKKNIKAISTLIIVHLIFENILLKNVGIIETLLSKINFNKEVIKVINIIMLCTLKEKMNNSINIFYKKYIILDIFDKIFNTKNKDIINNTSQDIKKILNFYYNLKKY